MIRETGYKIQNYQTKKMKIFPNIIQHGNQQSSETLQINDYQTLKNKISMVSIETQLTKVYNTNATLNSPLHDPSLAIQQQYHFKKQAKQCRICLQNSTQNDKLLIKICKCSGSIEFVHQECFKQWVQKSLQHKNKQERNKIMKKKQIDCQMCKQKIKIAFQQDSQRATIQQIKFLIKNKPKMFTFILVLCIGTFTSVIYLIIKLAIEGVAFDSSNSRFYDSLFSICSLILLIVLNCISIFFLVEQFFIKISLKVRIKQEHEFSPKPIRKSSTNTITNSINNISYDDCPQSPLHIAPIHRRQQSRRKLHSQRKRDNSSPMQLSVPEQKIDKKRASSPQISIKQKIDLKNKNKLSQSLSITLHQVLMSDDIQNIPQL